MLAWNEHGSVLVTRSFGTTTEGGEFENVLIYAVVIDRESDLVVNWELSIVDDEAGDVRPGSPSSAGVAT